MRDYWNISFGPDNPHGQGSRTYLEYCVPDDDLTEAIREITETYGDNYAVYECEGWEGIDFKTRRFSAEEIWRIATIANEQESPQAFLSWVAETNAVSLGIPDDLSARFQKAYRGVFDDLADFAKDFAEGMGVEDFIYPYVKWDEFGQALAMDYTITNLSSGRVAAFRQS